MRAFHTPQDVKSINIPDTVTSIGDEAFRQNFGLVAVNMSKSITAIGNGAFRDTPNLRSLALPRTLTTIATRAFQNCWLQSVSIPDSVTSLGSAAFMWTWSLGNASAIHLSTGLTSSALTALDSTTAESRHGRARTLALRARTTTPRSQDPRPMRADRPPPVPH